MNYKIHYNLTINNETKECVAYMKGVDIHDALYKVCEKESSKHPNQDIKIKMIWFDETQGGN